jgi:hypothetical protein
MGGTGWRTAAVAAGASALLLAGAGTGGAQGPRIDRYTPLVPSVMSTPRWFEGTDSRAHLVYELQMVNGFAVPVTVTGVTVRNAATDRPVATYRGAGLRASTSLMASPTEPETTIPASATGVVWIDIPFPGRRTIPARLEHTLTARVPPGLPVPRTIRMTGAAARVDRRPPPVIGAPLTGSGWAAVGSCCDGPHRRSIQPVNGRLKLGQRFAIDFNRLDARNRLVAGDPALNESFPTYDQPVLAVADATVVKAVDRYADQIPNRQGPITLQSASGNNVVLDLGRGRFAEYAHLKPGSVLVRAGTRVTKGQVLGRTGSTGSSTGPHLHFQLMDGPSTIDSDGIPYVFERFDVQGRMPPLSDALFAAANRGESLAVAGGPIGPHRHQLPLGLDVLTLP